MKARMKAWLKAGMKVLAFTMVAGLIGYVFGGVKGVAVIEVALLLGFIASKAIQAGDAARWWLEVVVWGLAGFATLFDIAFLVAMMMTRGDQPLREADQKPKWTVQTTSVGQSSTGTQDGSGDPYSLKRPDISDLGADKIGAIDLSTRLRRS